MCKSHENGEQTAVPDKFPLLPFVQKHAQKPPSKICSVIRAVRISMDEKRADVIQFLRELSNREMIETIQFALNSRREEYKNERGFEVFGLCVAQTLVAQYEPEDGFVKEPEEDYVDVTLCAVPAPEVIDVDWDDVVCQYGECAKCKASIASVAKLAICPACGTKVQCT